MRLIRRLPKIDYSNGFTLIELLISVSLMTGILMASYVCLQAALTGRAIVEDRSDSLQTARVVMEMISSDLRAADRLSEQHEILGLDRTLEGIEADNIDFVTRHHTPGFPMEADFCEVSYFVVKHPESERFVLLRRRDPLPDDKPLEGGNREMLIDDIFGLKFEYYDGWDWYDDWGDAETPEETTQSEQSSLIASAGRTGFPQAVRVTLAIPEKSGTPLIPQTPAESEVPTTLPGAMVFQTIVYLNLSQSELESEGNGTSNVQDNGNNSTTQR